MNVREEFLGFTECKPGVTGEALADTIVGNPSNKRQLNMQKSCRQAYDEAGAMAGKTRGVVARIMSTYPKAVYTHCSSQSTNIPDVRNMMDVAGSIARFFQQFTKETTSSAKARHRLRTTKVQEVERPLKTRWVERHNAFEAFTELYESVIS